MKSQRAVIRFHWKNMDWYGRRRADLFLTTKLGSFCIIGEWCYHAHTTKELIIIFDTLSSLSEIEASLNMAGDPYMITLGKHGFDKKFNEE